MTQWNAHWHESSLTQDGKCSNIVFQIYILKFLAFLCLKYINKAICLIKIQYVLSRMSEKCENTVTIQCKYSCSTQGWGRRQQWILEPPLPEASPPHLQALLGALGISNWLQAPVGGSQVCGEQQGCVAPNLLVQNESPTVRERESERWPASGFWGTRTYHPTARKTENGSVLLKFGCEKYFQMQGSFIWVGSSSRANFLFQIPLGEPPNLEERRRQSTRIPIYELLLFTL